MLLTIKIIDTHTYNFLQPDIHLRNILVKLPSDFNHLSVEELYEEYGESETVSITRCDGKPLLPNAPSKAVIPLYLGKGAEDFSQSDAHTLLGDFDEAFAPDLETRRGKDCHTPLEMQPPEARFELEAPLSYSADIWGLAIAIWEILDMQPIFCNAFVTADEIVNSISTNRRAWSLTLRLVDALAGAKPIF